MSRHEADLAVSVESFISSAMRKMRSLKSQNLQLFSERTSYSDSPKKFSETDIIEMLEFLIDNIFALFGGCVFHHIIAFLCVPRKGVFLSALIVNIEVYIKV
jgi:hypothetical protein